MCKKREGPSCSECSAHSSTGCVVGDVTLGGTTYAAPRRFVFAAVLAAFCALLWSAPPASAAVVVQPTLVQTIATSAYAQPTRILRASLIGPAETSS